MENLNVLLRSTPHKVIDSEIEHMTTTTTTMMSALMMDEYVAERRQVEDDTVF